MLKSKKKILALVGMCGAGKSSAALVLDELNIKGVYFGKLTLDYLKENGRVVNPREEKWAREKLRKEQGMAVFAKMALPKIIHLLNDHDLVYLDGLYSLEEYEYLKSALTTSLILIEIFADKQTRHSRLAKRKNRPLTLDECSTRDLDEVKVLNKAGPIALSDYKVANNEGPENLAKSLKELLSKIKSS